MAGQQFGVVQQQGVQVEEFADLVGERAVQAVAQLVHLGAHHVVLARETSLADLAASQSAQPAAPLPLEIFVHGALCVAYSGQCLTSEALGGRSANRGECAQACRLPYELLSDGQPVPLGDRKYLLSPQDLAGIDLLPTWTQQQLGLQQHAWQRPLIRAGVHSIAPLLRWAVRNGASHRSRKRMGLPPR